MPRRSRVGLALPVLALAFAIAGCGHNGPAAGPGSVEGTPAQITAAALLYINQFRGQAGEAPLTDAPAMDTAAVSHAGWMVLNNNGLTHFETVDGTAGGIPASTNPLFTGVQPGDRVRAQNTGADIVPGAAYHEVISSVPGPTAVDWMWNTVYHRLPLMRRSSTLFGFGDWDASLDQFPFNSLPAGSGYATLLVAQDPSVTTVIAGSWPATGATGILLSYDPNTETPNPFAPGNAGQNPGTSSTGPIGPPLHVILPTSQDWSTITVTLTIQGTAVALPLFLLCGGGTVPTLGAAATSPASTVSTDSQLQQGELFFLSQSPLLPNTTYQATISATTVGTSPDTIELGVSAPWTFTTGN
jgi:hypothetical protein